MLKDIAATYYNNNYNCAETLLRASNEYYGLNLNDRDMIMMGGYGGGMQVGSSCGTILGAIAALSIKYIEAKAHESADIGPVVRLLTEKFNEKFGSTLCKDIKPNYFTKELRCGNTIAIACDILEETLSEYEAQKA